MGWWVNAPCVYREIDKKLTWCMVNNGQLRRRSGVQPPSCMARSCLSSYANYKTAVRGSQAKPNNITASCSWVKKYFLTCEEIRHGIIKDCNAIFRKSNCVETATKLLLFSLISCQFAGTPFSCLPLTYTYYITTSSPSQDSFLESKVKEVFQIIARKWSSYPKTFYPKNSQPVQGCPSPVEINNIIWGLL